MLFFLLIRLHNMSVYRGKGALEMEVRAPVSRRRRWCRGSEPRMQGSEPRLRLHARCTARHPQPRCRCPLPPCLHRRSQPDRMLLADRPFTDRARSHLTMFVVWLALVAAAAVFLAARLLQYTECARLRAWLVGAGRGACWEGVTWVMAARRRGSRVPSPSLTRAC